MSFCRCLFALTLVVTLLGCGSPPAPPADDRPGAEFRTGRLIEPGYAQQFDYATRWVRDIVLARGQEIYAVRMLGDLLVVVERPRNVVTALRLSDGALLWKKVLGQQLEQLFPAVADDQAVYVTSRRRVFKIDRARGELLEIQNLDYTIDSPSVLLDRRLIAGALDGTVFGHDVDVRYKIWAYALPDRITAAPVMIDDKVFFADISGNYVMLRARDGELRWNGSAYGPITAAPVVDRQSIVIASQDQSLYSLNANTGRQRWNPYRSDVPLTRSPIVVDGMIYLSEPGIGLTVIDGDTGQPQWTTQDDFVPLVTRNGQLLVHRDQSLARLDPDDGQILAEIPTRPLQEVRASDEGSLILVGKDGELIRIDPQ